MVKQTKIEAKGKDSQQIKEFKAALKEGRQPKCVYCEHPLDEVRQTQYTQIRWGWDDTKKKFIKDDSGGDADQPYCQRCYSKDWEFVDGCEVAVKLGLTY